MGRTTRSPGRGAAAGGDDPGAVEVPLIWLLRRTTRRYRPGVTRALAAAGLGDLPQQGTWAVHAIGRGQATTAADLVAAMGITKQAVSQLVEGLVSLGYVERRADAQDRRRTRLVLGARGAEAAAVIDGALDAADAAAAERVGPEAMAQLRRTLVALAADQVDTGTYQPVTSTTTLTEPEKL